MHVSLRTFLKKQRLLLFSNSTSFLMHAESPPLLCASPPDPMDFKFWAVLAAMAWLLAIFPLTSKDNFPYKNPLLPGHSFFLLPSEIFRCVLKVFLKKSPFSAIFLLLPTKTPIRAATMRPLTKKRISSHNPKEPPFLPSIKKLLLCLLSHVYISLSLKPKSP